LAPLIIVIRYTSEENLPVNRARTANELAPRKLKGLAVRRGLSLVSPNMGILTVCSGPNSIPIFNYVWGRFEIFIIRAGLSKKHRFIGVFC
jgi:hypothetical protein